jgi:two-component system sensor histidine kinase PilS (NtrC family)
MKKIKPQNFISQILFDSTPREGGSDYWRALFYLNIYRILLAALLVTVSLTTIDVGSLGSRDPGLFSYASFSYACLSILFAFFIYKGWPHYITQCRLQILADIVIIIILYYASGGRGAGLEIPATILLILEHIYVIATNQRALGGFTTLGLIGSGLFITAFIIYYLSLILRRTEVEIAQQNLDLQKLSNINELIVEQLHSGVIVVDQSLKLILINQSGRKLLDLPAAGPITQTLEGLLPDISLDVNDLEENIDGITSKIRLPSGKKLLTRYKPLDDSFENGFIILLDDYSQIEQDQRNEKFIAMGRLSASIAHEIRNPLGAISHAGQLLAESPLIIKNDSRLVEIIENQSQRINQIVKTILELGQTKDLKLEKIPLRLWLEKIINNFIIEKSLSDKAILLNGKNSITACGDPEQLQYVILNLLSNSLRYANTDDKPFIVISIGEDEFNATSSISIADNGPGVEENIRDKIFEPFFTTSPTGNGLGLYIARKICLGNHGHLDYNYLENGNSFFRLTLATNGTCNNHSSNRSLD